MADPVAKSACAGLLPVTVGALSLEETDIGVLTTVAPYLGRGADLSAAMEKAHGVTLPGPGRTTGEGDARAIWFGRDMALLVGPAPDAALAKYAALTDQSDAWAVVTLSGEGSDDALARLVPLDLRAAQFEAGHTARSQIMHMNASITRTGPDSFLILVFRAMAQTLVHELKTAMEGVAARR
ncbi:sarcosine oxidase subunit gamma [Roseobacter ponti]|uniref:sarcosine oxidase subunit gamma n=1 Tax=Roseobacter ponti TaxID=1891787 RepID=UPI001FE3644D|nr:sarcosine oxidase subunit gamma [Roseobacter ponti]